MVANIWYAGAVDRSKRVLARTRECLGISCKRFIE